MRGCLICEVEFTSLIARGAFFLKALQAHAREQRAVEGAAGGGANTRA